MVRKNKGPGGGSSTGTNHNTKQKSNRNNNDRNSNKDNNYNRNDSYESISFDPTNLLVDYSSSSSVRVTLFAAFISLLIGAIFGASFASNTPSLGSTQQQHPFGVPTTNNNHHHQGQYHHQQTYHHGHNQQHAVQQQQQQHNHHNMPYNNGNSITAGAGGMTANVMNSGGNVVSGAGTISTSTSSTPSSVSNTNAASRQAQVQQTAAQIIQQNLNAHFANNNNGQNGNGVPNVHVHINEVKVSTTSTASPPSLVSSSSSSSSSMGSSSMMSGSASPSASNTQSPSSSSSFSGHRLSSTTANMMISSSSPSSWSSFSYSSAPGIITSFSSDIGNDHHHHASNGASPLPSYTTGGRDEINNNNGAVHLQHVTNLVHDSSFQGEKSRYSPSQHSSAAHNNKPLTEQYHSKETSEIDDDDLHKPYIPQSEQPIINLIHHDDPTIANAVNPHHTTLPTISMMNINGVTGNNGHDHYYPHEGGRDSASSYEEHLYHEHGHSDYEHYASGSTPTILPRKTAVPTLCSDGFTVGYSDWFTLRQAITETNDRMTNLFLQWKDYYVAMVEYESALQRYHDHQYTHGGGGADDVLEPPTPPTPPAEEHNDPQSNEPFVICPDTTLRTPRHARAAPIYINAEDIRLECDNCMIDVGGTHLSFGPHAKGALVKGITFTGAQTSSVVFHYHGADVVFEDCYWVGNAGSGSAGAVADLNSTSSVTFNRCELSDFKQVPRSLGMANGGHGHMTSVSSSLTIRN